jgi:hypothetical protein
LNRYKKLSKENCDDLPFSDQSPDYSSGQQKITDIINLGSIEKSEQHENTESIIVMCSWCNEIS